MLLFSMYNTVADHDIFRGLEFFLTADFWK